MSFGQLLAELLDFFLVPAAFLLDEGPQRLYLNHQISHLHILNRVLHIDQLDLLQCDKISQLDDLLAEFENQHHIGRLAIIRAWTGHKRAIKTVLQQVVFDVQLVSSHV